MATHIIRFADLPDHVGRYLGASGWTAIGQAQTDAFAGLTGDEEWIHVDVDRATRERGGTIVHGYHLLSLIPALIEQIFRPAMIADCLFMLVPVARDRTV